MASGATSREGELAEQGYAAFDPDAVVHQAPGKLQRALTPRAIFIGIICVWLCGYWIRQAEIVALACQITESVPVIPGIAVLLLLVMGNAVGRRFGLFRPLTAGEMLVIFLFVTVATFMFACGIVRFMIASVSAPFYYSNPAAPTEQLARHIPSWLTPSDRYIHVMLYEGAPAGKVPWDVWAVPVLAWSGFLALLAFVLLSAVVILSEPWVEKERLIFPLVRLPLEIVHGRQASRPFFANPVTWVGIGAAFLWNAFNVVRGVWFAGPSGGFHVDISPVLVDPPLNYLRPFTAELRPELVGLGYLVSTELSFSIWFFFLLTKIEGMFLQMGGYRVAGTPFPQEQSIGAYIVLGVILLWKARHYIADAWRTIGAKYVDDHSRRQTYGWAFAGVIFGFVGLVVFCVCAGMAIWLAVLYLAIIIIVSLVYARLRAETGIPLVWMFPYGQQAKLVSFALGSHPLSATGPASVAIFTLLGFLSRGFFPSVSGYHIEGLRLADASRMPRRDILIAVTAAVIIGTMAAFYFHLPAYYEKGAIGLRGGLWGADEAQAQFSAALRYMDVPVAPDMARITAAASGALATAAMTLIRARFLTFPVHPLGYAMATAFGDLIWAPFFIVWVVKTLMLRYSGNKLYLAAMPAFMGFALGHFIAAGAIWGSLGAALGGIFLRYGVWFG
jgi:hypothetical protein